MRPIRDASPPPRDGDSLCIPLATPKHRLGLAFLRLGYWYGLGQDC
jgi:hypothetical protein